MQTVGDLCEEDWRQFGVVGRLDYSLLCTRQIDELSELNNKLQAN